MEPLVEVRNLCKYFGNVRAVDDVGMKVYPGEIVGLLGDNGAGKSTLIKVISGVYPPTSGHVYFEGEERVFSSPKEARALGIETLYQDLALAGNLEVPANIFLGREQMRPLLSRLPVFRNLKILDRKRMAQEAATALDSLHIEIASLEADTRNLSGGQQQAVAITRAVYWNAKLVIMDEPMAALGVPEQRMVRELARTLRDRGVGLIMISHNLADVFAVADRAVVLRRGKRVGECVLCDVTPEHIVSLIVGSEEVGRAAYA
jgi:simple sugar transport system ATP-binding protein